MDPVKTAIDALLSRQAPGGGFPIRPGRNVRPEATAWAAIALLRHGGGGEAARNACRELARIQKENGSLVVSDHAPGAVWPTPLALMAWQLEGGYREERDRAARFLLEHSGSHFPFDPNGPVGHDTSIRGWPWVLGSHSWIIPTSLAVIALDGEGYRDHERVTEGIRMIMNRQLASGGWNYGNTTVFGRELRPQLEATGMALAALKGYTEARSVAGSLAYLRADLAEVLTPLSVGWALLGGVAWGQPPPDAAKLIDETLELQRVRGPYDTGALAVLITAAATAGGRS